MIVFSQRLKLELLFSKWAEENGVRMASGTMLAFLVGNGLLDEEATIKFLEEKYHDR